MSPLSDRIAHALQGEPSATDLDHLIQEAEADLRRLSSERAQAHLTALDPLSSSEAVTTARSDSQRLSFEEERLHVALDRLRARHEAALAHEENLRRKEHHREVMAERDQVAKELADRYVSLAAQLADLLGRVAAANARVEAVNRAGGPWLDPVETVARGLPANGIHLLLTATRLPPWDPEAQAHGRMMWPPQPAPTAAVISPEAAAWSAARGHEMRRIREVVGAQKAAEVGAARRRIG